MSFSDALKKYRESQGYQAPVSSTDEEDEKYSGTATKNFIIKSFNDGKESDKTESNGKTDGVSTTPNRPNDGGNVAQTGDSANVMIYIVFAGVTALAMMAFAIFRKKVN